MFLWPLLACFLARASSQPPFFSSFQSLVAFIHCEPCVRACVRAVALLFPSRLYLASPPPPFFRFFYGFCGSRRLHSVQTSTHTQAHTQAHTHTHLFPLQIDRIQLPQVSNVPPSLNSKKLPSRIKQRKPRAPERSEKSAVQSTTLCQGEGGKGKRKKEREKRKAVGGMQHHQQHPSVVIIIIWPLMPLGSCFPCPFCPFCPFRYCLVFWALSCQPFCSALACSRHQQHRRLRLRPPLASLRAPL